MADSIYRRLTKEKLGAVTLRGEILDLGGRRGADYHRFMTRDGRVQIVNLDPDAKPDLVHNLEEPLPFSDGQYDAILLVNVLEHLYHYDRVLRESKRLLRPDGQVVAAVPFLFPIHSAPGDYFRYTRSALERVFADAGFRRIEITEIGGGLCLACVNLWHRLLPPLVRELCEFLARSADGLLVLAARLFGKAYRGVEYPLGYFVHASK